MMTKRADSNGAINARLAGLAVVILVGLAAAWWLYQRRIDATLLRTQPDIILRDARLLKRAVDQGQPLYREHCAGCHGAQLEGDPRRGVPDLAKGVWLYGNDPTDVERTILYGIRSGHPKARNIADMPAEVRTGQITASDARDVVEFLQKLAGMPHDEAMAARGRSIYYDKGNCYDCHANDARGVIDYGTPALTGPVWLYGGDRDTLYETVLNGRHGICPAWINRLAPAQIRALAFYLVTKGGAPRGSVGN
jgi:cytochrome c oxidase cbb3-type subunit 3